MSQTPPLSPLGVIQAPAAEDRLVDWPLQLAHRALSAGWIIVLISVWTLVKNWHIAAAPAAFFLAAVAGILALWAHFAGQPEVRSDAQPPILLAAFLGAAATGWVLAVILTLADAPDRWLWASVGLVLLAVVGAILFLILPGKARSAGSTSLTISFAAIAIAWLSPLGNAAMGIALNRSSVCWATALLLAGATCAIVALVRGKRAGLRCEAVGATLVSCVLQVAAATVYLIGLRPGGVR